MLLAAGADMNAADQDNCTALMVAIQKSNFQLVEVSFLVLICVKCELKWGLIECLVFLHLVK